MTESFLTFACAGLIGILFGTLVAFAGYRLFLLLLPVWGFFFGLALGAQSLQVLFGDGFLATVTSWVVGFVVGLLFALLSYIFYAFAVAIIAGSLGYALAVGILTWIGLDMGVIVWLIGVVTAIAFAFVTIIFNLQKWVVILATSILGTATIFGTILLMFNPAAKLLENPIQTLLGTSPFLLIMFILIAGLGFFVQMRANRMYQVEEYNRVDEFGF